MNEGKNEGGKHNHNTQTFSEEEVITNANWWIVEAVLH
jgi:hypothetical protein